LGLIREFNDVLQAVVRWLEAVRCPGRLDEPTLADILPHIRFAMMSADQLCELEKQPIVERYQALFSPYINRAYKYLSLSLSARSTIREFQGPGFLLRNYTEIRWDKRLVLANYSTYQRCSEVCRAKISEIDKSSCFRWSVCSKSASETA
jgi:hypothetical protein